MRLTDDERDFLSELLKPYRDQYGERAITDIYDIYKKFLAKTGIRYFPLRDAFFDDLFYRVERYQKEGCSLTAIADKEQRDRKVIGKFFHKYFLPRKKREAKKPPS